MKGCEFLASNFYTEPQHISSTVQEATEKVLQVSVVAFLKDQCKESLLSVMESSKSSTPLPFSTLFTRPVQIRSWTMSLLS